MLKWLIRNRLDAFQREFDYDMSYARDILEADTSAVIAFSKINAMSEYRRDVPKDPYWAARVVATVSEDCGPCTQLIVTMGLRDGATAGVLAAVLAKNDAALPDDARLGVRFARAALAHDPQADELRAEIEKRWGARAVVSLAFGIASARVFPTLKYALGHGKTCQRVVVAGEKVDVIRAPERSASGRMKRSAS